MQMNGTTMQVIKHIDKREGQARLYRPTALNSTTGRLAPYFLLGVQHLKNLSFNSMLTTYGATSITRSSVLAESKVITMTKKDYELIAGVFAKELQNLQSLLSFKGKITPFNEGQLQEVKTIMKQMIRALEQENPKFDSEKFLQVCLQVKN